MSSENYIFSSIAGKWFWLIMLFFWQCYPVEAQTKPYPQFHDCNHFCAHTKNFISQAGIYEQDPRLHDYDIKFYGLFLEVNPSSTFLKGSVRIIAEITAQQSAVLVLELTDNLNVERVVHVNKELSFSHENKVLAIELGEAQPTGTLIDLEVFYSGQPESQGFFSGIQSSTNSLGDPVLWTLSEPHNARQWFPCKQVLSDKADSAYIFITTPAQYVVASNGLLTQIVDLPDGQRRYEWKTFYPIAYYLISIAVADYQQYNFYAPLATSSDSVFIQNFIYNYPEVLESQKQNLENTRDMMLLFSEFWGDYPFASEKYGHAQAPMGGGMEHQTISTMGYFGFDITAHELAHHWFGNQVTCASWSDIWINEGFASYGEYMAREFLVNRQSADNWMRAAHELVMSEPGGSIFIPPYELSDIWRIFNGRLSYKKGAAILHQLRFEIDDDILFFQVMEDFQYTFAHDVASGEDFRKSLESNTGRDWEWFFDQWYYGEGYPTYHIYWQQENGYLNIQSSQTTSTGTTPFFKGSIEFLVKTQDMDTTFRFFQQEPLEEFQVAWDKSIQEFIMDPDNFMLKKYLITDSNSIATPKVNAIEVMPNPFHNKISINFTAAWQNAQYNLTDIQGRNLKEGILSGAFHSLDLSVIKAGIYLMYFISQKGEVKTFKLVKQ